MASTLPFRLPWQLTAAVLVVYVAVGIRAETVGILPLLAVALLATYVIPYRMPQRSRTPWIVRIVAYGWITTTMGRDQSGPFMFSDSTTNAIASIWCIEAVVQAWQERPAGKPSGASLIAVSALAFNAAAWTEDETYVKWLVPIYMALILLSLRPLERGDRASGTLDVQERALDTRRAVESPAAHPPSQGFVYPDHTPRTAMLLIGAVRLAALICAVGAGYAGYAAMYTYKDRLTSIGTSWTPPTHARGVGLSVAPTLGAMSDGEGSPTRVLRIVGPISDPHLRGLTFSTYDHGSWLPTVDRRRFDDASPIALHSRARGIKTRVHCLSDGLNVLVAPLTTTGVDPVDGISISQEADQGGSLQTDAATPYAYDLTESPPRVLPEGEGRLAISNASVRLAKDSHWGGGARTPAPHYWGGGARTPAPHSWAGRPPVFSKPRRRGMNCSCTWRFPRRSSPASGPWPSVRWPIGAEAGAKVQQRVPVKMLVF